jgi:hypothetical protein
MERFNILRNYVKFYNNVQVSATYSIPRSLLQNYSNSGIAGLVYAALKETVNHQAILGVTIKDEGSKEPKWVRLQTIDLRELVKIINVDPNASPDEWVQDAHRVPLTTTEDLPLWRVVVAFQDSALIENGGRVSFAVGFFGHHAFADGLSCGAFHLTFLDALNTLISSSSIPPSNSNEAAILSVPKLPLVPNLEMKATLSVSILFALYQIFKAFTYNPIDPLNWSGPNVSADQPRPPISSLISFSLPPLLVNKLVAKCRSEKTTITALVAALVARKLAVMYPEYKHFTGSVPFSLRKFTGHTARDMGCYVSNVEPHFSSEAKPPRGYISCASSTSEKSSPGEDAALWALARTTKEFITTKTSTTHNQMVNMLKFVSDYKSYFMGLLGKKRAHAFEVTNIGVVDGGVGNVEEGKASFDRVIFSSGHCTYGNPYCIYLATAKNGYMTVAVGWEVGVVGDEEAKDLLGFLEGVFKGLVEV